MLEIKFNHVLESCNSLPISSSGLLTLPDIIDIRCGCIGLAFYLLPISGWKWACHINKETVSMNSLTSWESTHCCEVILPTMNIEYSLCL